MFSSHVVTEAGIFLALSCVDLRAALRSFFVKRETFTPCSEAPSPFLPLGMNYDRAKNSLFGATVKVKARSQERGTGRACMAP